VFFLYQSFICWKGWHRWGSGIFRILQGRGNIEKKREIRNLVFEQFSEQRGFASQSQNDHAVALLIWKPIVPFRSEFSLRSVETSWPPWQSCSSGPRALPSFDLPERSGPWSRLISFFVAVEPRAVENYVVSCFLYATLWAAAVVGVAKPGKVAPEAFMSLRIYASQKFSSPSNLYVHFVMTSGPAMLIDFFS